MNKIQVLLIWLLMLLCLSASMSHARGKRDPVKGNMNIEILFENPDRPYKQLSIETVGSRYHNLALDLADCIEILQELAAEVGGEAIIIVDTLHASMDGTRHWATGIIINYTDNK